MSNLETNYQTVTLNSFFKYIKQILSNILFFPRELGYSFIQRARNRFGGYTDCNRMNAKPIFKFKGENPFDGFGTSMVLGDFNGDDHSEWAISAPFALNSDGISAGAIYILQNNITEFTQEFTQEAIKNPINVMNYSQRVLSFHVPSACFGHSMTIVDLNQDGIDDLAISAPSLGGLHLDYRGAVYVYFGSPKGLSLTPNITIEPLLKRTPHFPGSKWENNPIEFGETLFSFDLDGDGFKDLLIGSPRASFSKNQSQVGSVHAFYSSSLYTGVIQAHLADWSLTGHENYEWFGISMDFIINEMVIGAPGYLNSSGRVYGYQMMFKTPILKYILESKSPQNHFGRYVSFLNCILMFKCTNAFRNVKISQNLLIVSSPWKWNSNTQPSLSLFPALFINPSIKGSEAGSIQLYNTSHLKGIIDSESFKLNEIQGTQTFGHFGNAMTLVENDLWISESFGNSPRLVKIQEFSFSLKKTHQCIIGLPNQNRFGELFGIEKGKNNDRVLISFTDLNQMGMVLMYDLI